MKKDMKWEKVSFAEGKIEISACELTFRPNGQIVFGASTVEALKYPGYVNLYINASDNLIAIKSTTKSEADTIQLGATETARGESRTIMAKKVFRWLCGLLKQEEGQVLIKLAGEPNDEGMVVFDLSKAEIKPKRTRKTVADA